MSNTRKKTLALLLAGLTMLAGAAPSSRSQTTTRRASYIPYEEARPILEALGEILPAPLKADARTAWARWTTSRDAEIRTRLIQGDEDSLVNFLLFGTSFTRRPRITLEDLAQAGRRGAESPDVMLVMEQIKLRADDLIQGLIAPASNERLLFGRRVIDGKGYTLKTDAERARVKNYLIDSFFRVIGESSSYAKILESARMQGDPSAEFAERSKLFRDRGLSSDTTLMPNFAIERSLASLKARGLIAAGSIRRVAIVGPGLDFADKQDGYDFYPQQTIQPFALIDSLLRLGLARANELRLTTLDLSPRINAHLERARQQAAQGTGYTVQLPRDSQWKPELADYWSKFGDQIGAAVAPVAVPAGLGDVKVRAVRIRPGIVSLISSADVNIVLQRLDLAKEEAFDIIIATNILVYYDVFEQSLALANVERMLRPGGFLLSNNALLELPSSGVHSVGYETAVYSDRPGDGDHIVWYQRAAK